MTIYEQIKEINDADIIYAVVSLKGGVSKTTTSSSIAYYLAHRMKKKVALLDMDTTNPTLPKVMGLQGRKLRFTDRGLIAPIKYSKNLLVMSVDFFLPSYDQPILLKEIQKKRLLIQMLKSVEYGKCDYIVFDTPPTTSPELMTILKTFPAKKLRIIILSQPGGASSNSAIKTIQHLKATGIPINGIITSMDGYTCKGCGLYDPIFPNPVSIEKIAKKYQIPYLGGIQLGSVKRTKKGAWILQSPSFDSVMENILKTKPVKFKPLRKKLSLFQKIKIARAIDKNLTRKIRGDVK